MPRRADERGGKRISSRSNSIQRVHGCRSPIADTGRVATARLHCSSSSGRAAPGTVRHSVAQAGQIESAKLRRAVACHLRGACQSATSHLLPAVHRR